MQKKISSDIKKKEPGFYWQIICMFAGMFFGIFTFAFIGSATLVPNIFLSKILAFFCFIGLLIPFRFYKKWFEMNKVEAALFNIMAIGPTVCALLLWTNFLIRTSEKEETFNVVSVKFIEAEHFDNLELIFTLENDSVYKGYPKFRTVMLEKGDLKKAESGKLKIKTAEGLLGFRIYLGNEAIAGTTKEELNNTDYK